MTPASVLPPRCGYPQDDCIKQLPGRLELSPVRVAPGGVIAVDALATVSGLVGMVVVLTWCVSAGSPCLMRRSPRAAAGLGPCRRGVRGLG